MAVNLSVKVQELPRQVRHCLAVLCEFNDVAHAARRLHCSQAQVLSRISELQQRLGRNAVVLEHRTVFIDPKVKEMIFNGKEPQ